MLFSLLPAWQTVLPAGPGKASHKQMTTTCGARILSIGLQFAQHLPAISTYAARGTDRQSRAPCGSPLLWDQLLTFHHHSRHRFPSPTQGALLVPELKVAALC